MMLRQLLVLSLLAVSVSQTTAAIVDGVRQKPKPQTSGFVADQEAYLYNIGAQAFFTQGNSWTTTQAMNYAENPSSIALSPLLMPGEGHHIDQAKVSLEEYESTVPKMAVNDKAQKLKAIIDNASDKEDVDVTVLLKNPEYEDGTNGWTITRADGGNVEVAGLPNNKCFEAFNNAGFDIYQTVSGAPVGVYEIEVQGFYRYLRDEAAWNAYKAQSVDYVKPQGVPVYVYMNNNATPFKNIFSEPVPQGTLYTTDTSLLYPAPLLPCNDDRGNWYPNEMYNSAEAFSAGMYKQSAFGLVARDGDVMRLGVKGASNQGNDSWVIWDNFKLTFRGFKADVVKPVLEAEIANVNETYIGLLMGKTEYAAFTTALADAAKAIEMNDGEGMFNALNALYDAKAPALISKDIFLAQEVAADTLRLAEAISAMEGKKLSKATLDNAGTLLDGLKNNALYENDQIDQLKSDVTNMISTLDNSVALYEQLNEAIGRLQAAITEFSGEDVIVSKDVLDGANALLFSSTANYNEGSIADSDIPGHIDSIDKAIEEINESVRLYEQLANAIATLKETIVDAKKEPLINDQLINAADDLVGTASENNANRNLDNNGVKELINDIQTEIDGLRAAIGALYFSVYPLTYHITSLSEDNLTVEVSSCSLDYTGDLYIPDTVTYNGKTYTVTGIAPYAFRACVFVTTIHVGENVKEIGACAFMDMTGLVYIYIPSTVISMGPGCFDGCSSINGLNYYGSADSDIALNYDEGTDEIIVVVEVWNDITSVTLPSTLKRIGERAFWGCFKLMTVTSKIEDLFPIDEDVFSETTYLFGTLVVPDGMADVYRRTPGWSKFQNIVEASAVGINAAKSKDLADSNIYTLGGLKVNDKQKKGLYIENGKKVVK